MAAITIDRARAQLDAYLAAETAVLAEQAYEIAGRRLTRANLGEIQRGIELWSARVAALEARGAGYGRARTVIAGW